jgi:glycerophosphoryl diester phosphodiesterase
MNSKDDSLMVFHDLNTKNITGIDYNIVETNSNILRTLNIGKGEKMPYLNEVFKILPKGKKIFLEVKWWQDANAINNKQLTTILLNQIEKSGRANDCVVICFSVEYLIRLKMIDPKLNLFWINYDKDKYKTTADVLKKYNFQGVNALWSFIDNDFTSDLESKNKFNYAWTVNDGNVAIDLYQKFKIDGIFTDKPDVIRKALAKVSN